jgi:hypothetical protein
MTLEQLNALRDLVDVARKYANAFEPWDGETTGRVLDDLARAVRQLTASEWRELHYAIANQAIHADLDTCAGGECASCRGPCRFYKSDAELAAARGAA